MSVLNSIVSPARSRVVLAMMSALVMVTGMLFGAKVAAADSVQVQSYQRASQTQACVAQPGETPWQASWGTNSSWAPSWERWANKGNGGWTCTRSITWARTPAAASGGGGGGSVTYALGDIGPGGGLVFLIAGGKTYEMAPKTWGVNETTGVAWMTNTPQCYATDSSDAVSNCQSSDLYPGTTEQQSLSTNSSTAVGMGSANTDAIIARMNAGSVASSDYAAGAARAYDGGGYTDWFLPSREELEAMYAYRDSIVDTATYGFATEIYWSSSQANSGRARDQLFSVVFEYGGAGLKYTTWRVRPVRSF